LNEGSYGLLLDPLNGIADLESRTLRLVSPYGFIEDPSRLLRAVRLQSRTGWEMDERTRTRYENAKQEGVMDSISPYLKGYELEEIVHEEDALKALKALESEGWMKEIFPAWTSAKADTRGLEALHQTLVQLLIQGIHPDLSAAQMELLTAKLPPKDLSALKRLFPQPGFVKHWEKLEHSAKEFQKELLDRKSASASATWKLLTSYAPEAVLWLAYTSKNAQVQTKFKNFATVWPEARQKIPTAMMLEMRITPDLPGYENLVQEIFFQLMDSKLTTDEQMRAFLEPHSPPAPPPPVSIRRTRAKKAARIVEEDQDENVDEAGEEDADEQDDASIKLAPPKKAGSLKVAKSEAANAKGATAEAAGKRGKAGVAAKTTAPAKPPVSAKAPVPAKAVAPEKPSTKMPAAKAAASKAAAGKHRGAKAVPAKKAAKSVKPAKKAQKPVARVHKKAAVKPVKKPAAKPVRKPVAKKAAKAAKKKR
jgi:hypothetical protein